ncbi:MAG: efflux RND transporter permease subunit [Sphingobacteriaceae bacterium]|nr:efflux RND transporter permease subunit [Sphingobacteriaceae bacterium]
MDFIFKNSKLLLLVTAFLTLGAFYRATKISFIYDLEAFFPKDDPDVAFMASFKERLQRDDLFLMVAIDREQDIYDVAFLKKVNAFTLACKALPNIQSAESVTTLKEPLKTPFGLSSRRLLHWEDSSRLENDRLVIRADERIRNNLVSADEQALVVSMTTTGQLSQAEANLLNYQIDSLINAYEFHKTHTAGVITTQAVFVQKIEEELLLYIALSILIVTIVLFFLYKSFWGIVIPLASVVVSLAVFLGYMELSGQSFDVISTMFPTLMLIFGMSDVIHLQSKYIDELEKNKSRWQAMRTAFKEIGTALLLTSITTAIGFGSLLLSSIPAIQRFGLNAAVGVLIAYVFVLIFASAALLHFDRPQLQNIRKQRSNWRKFSLTLYLQNRKYPVQISLIAVFVLLLSAFGISKISTNSYLLGDIPRESKLRQDFLFFESKFAGVRPFEIAILPATGKKILDQDVIIQTAKLTDYLQSKFAIGAIQSPVVFIKSIHKSWNGGAADQYSIPESTEAYDDIRKVAVNFAKRAAYKLFDEDQTIGRISARIQDTGSDSLALDMVEIENWMTQNIDPSVASFKMTGSVLLVDKNHEYLRKNLFQGLLLAFFLVGIIFSVLFKDWRMVLVSIIPNIVPMIIAGAALGFTGIELKAVTAVIFTVSFGIAVDDTIHFLTRYKLERTKGRSVDASLRQTFLVSVKAITITTIILIFGFISLIFSSFTGTYYVGVLVCITLISALIADIYIIPQLLYWINPGSRPKAGKRGASQK